jgi:ligand-binding SRPBCC domain-containing protein
MDRVHYVVPVGTLGDLCAGWLVRRDVKRIFDYRAKQIPSMFNEQSVLRTWSGNG